MTSTNATLIGPSPQVGILVLSSGTGTLDVTGQTTIDGPGSDGIDIDGVSLTVNEVGGNSFSVCLIPHTLEITTLGSLSPGDEVNLEVDLIARYLERLINGRAEPQASDQKVLATLVKSGFVKP